MEKSNKVYMILTNGFDPDVRVYKEAKYLVKNGFDVTILCWDRKCEYIEKEEENIEGIKVKRFFIKSVPGTGMKQLIPYFRFIKKVKEYLKDKRYNYLHCHDLDGMIIGYIIHKKDIKVVFDMHEFYEKSGHKLMSCCIRKLVGFLQSYADRIIHVNEQQKEGMTSKNIQKLLWIPNYPIMEQFKNTTHIKSEQLRILYAGYVRYLEPLTNLARAVNDMSNVSVSIHGVGEKFEEVKKLQEQYKNFKVYGKYRYDEIAEFYSNSDLVYIVYDKENKNAETALPTKFFESIATQTPMIVSEKSLLEDTVNKYDIGFSVDGTKYEDIKSTLIYIQENKNALEQKISNIKKITNKFSWEEVVKKLDSIYL